MEVKNLRKLLKRLWRNTEAMTVARHVGGLIAALFILGAIGGMAVSMVANASAYSGVPAPVVTVFTVAVPIMAGVAIMLYFLPKRS